METVVTHWNRQPRAVKLSSLELLKRQVGTALRDMI